MNAVWLVHTNARKYENLFSGDRLEIVSALDTQGIGFKM